MAANDDSFGSGLSCMSRLPHNSGMEKQWMLSKSSCPCHITFLSSDEVCGDRNQNGSEATEAVQVAPTQSPSH